MKTNDDKSCADKKVGKGSCRQQRIIVIISKIPIDSFRPAIKKQFYKVPPLEANDKKVIGAFLAVIFAFGNKKVNPKKV